MSSSGTASGSFLKALRQEVFAEFGRDKLGEVEILSLDVATVFAAALAPRILNQDPPHRFRRRAKEMAARIPLLRRVPFYEPQVRLVHERRRLECLPRPFLGQFLRGQSSQLFVDQRQQLLRSVRVALLDGAENAVRDVGGSRNLQEMPSASYRHARLIAKGRLSANSFGRA